MSTVIAGRFDEQSSAEEATRALEAAGFTSARISRFFVLPPGQHDVHGTTDDPDASAGAHHAGTGALAGATAGGGIGVLAGIVTAPFLGPGAAIAGAAVGAYVGSLVGALEQTSDPRQTARPDAPAEEAAPRRSGVLVAVQAMTFEEQSNAIGALRAQGAQDIERAEGSIIDGDWSDFDPLRPPVLVTTQANMDRLSPGTLTGSR